MSIGSGEAWVFSGGTVQHGTWTRADRTQPFTLTDDAGNVMKLTPGRTFIELPRQTATSPVVSDQRGRVSGCRRRRPRCAGR